VEQKYYIYIIELDSSVVEKKNFLKQNPDMDPSLPFFYVGESIPPPAERFKQHKAGHKSIRWVRDYGKWVRRKLIGRYERKFGKAESREEALEIEAKVAEDLRSIGHGVWYN